MSRQVIVSATITVLALVGPSHAQLVESPRDTPMPPVIERPEDHTTQMTNYAVVFDAPETSPDAARRISAVMTRITSWLSTKFDLPATASHPRIELVSPRNMAVVLHRRLGMNWQTPATLELNDATLRERMQHIAALYEDASRTIFLPETWTGSSPAEVSVLVHEMVHHLQNAGGLKYECAGAREAVAYKAQQAWLARSGRDFFTEFDLDPMTLLVRTSCGF